MKKYKIICLTDSLHSGGAQKQIALLAKGLSERGVDVVLIQYHDLNFFEYLIEDTNIRRYLIKTKNFTKRAYKIVKIINDEKPSAVISFLFAANMYSILSKIVLLKTKCIYITGERNCNDKFNTKDFILRIPHFFSTFIVSNTRKQTSLINKYFGGKSKHIYNGVLNKNINHIKTIGPNITIKKMIIPARFAKQKNPLNLFKAVKQLKDEGYVFKIDWYGALTKDNYTDNTMLYFHSNKLNDFIEIKEHFMNIESIFKNYDGLILPSLHEGCPNALIDAMFLKLIPIVSNVADNSFIMDSSCKDLLFNPKDINSIKESLKFFLNLDVDESINIVNKNFNRAHDLFDFNKMIDNYSNLANVK